MKILIVTALYRRPELTRIVLKYYRSLQLSAKHELQLLAVGSTKADESLAIENGWKYVSFPNEPLSQKFNYLFESARAFDFDALLLTGSDDFVGSEIIRYYEQHYDHNADYVLGLKDLYFYSIQTDRLLYFEGFGPPAPKTIGAGRLFSRAILEAIDFRPWADEILPRGLDSACTKNFKKLGIGEVAVPMEVTGGIACDFKYAKANLTPFERLTKKGTFVNNILLSGFWPTEFEAIKSLRIPDPPPIEGFTLAQINDKRYAEEQRKKSGRRTKRWYMIINSKTIFLLLILTVRDA